MNENSLPLDQIAEIADCRLGGNIYDLAVARQDLPDCRLAAEPCSRVWLLP